VTALGSGDWNVRILPVHFASAGRPVLVATSTTAVRKRKIVVERKSATAGGTFDVTTLVSGAISPYARRATITPEDTPYVIPRNQSLFLLRSVSSPSAMSVSGRREQHSVYPQRNSKIIAAI